jgi:hypothetical protein
MLLGVALAGAAALAGCGGHATTTNTTTTTTTGAAVAPPAAKGLTSAQLRMAVIVRAWVGRLNANDNAALARLYALPTIAIQGLYEYKLKTRKQIALCFSRLPCSGEIVALGFSGDYATVIFHLRNRGSIKCDGPGTLAAARFRIVNGKIDYWAQIPLPKSANQSA